MFRLCRNRGTFARQLRDPGIAVAFLTGISQITYRLAARDQLGLGVVCRHHPIAYEICNAKISLLIVVVMREVQPFDFAKEA